MSQHESFRFANLEELEAKIRSLGLDVELDDDLSVLGRPVRIGGLEAPNSLAVHPMEGCDGTPDGNPDELTFRRYRRFGAGGAGLLWFEATAVLGEARANPHQLCLTEKNLPQFEKLLTTTRRVCRETSGTSHSPIMVLQLTHSGRYSRPFGRGEPIIAFHDPYLDQQMGIPANYPVISDAELEAIEDKFVEAAGMARRIGFDAVDFKSCHRYLSSGLLAAHTRKGRYGGSFENRTRFLRNVIGKTRQQIGEDLAIAVRLNAYDGIPYPYGWGMCADGTLREDLSEPRRLLKLLYDSGVRVVNISGGNPYYNPHVGRPYDQLAPDGPLPDEHPLVGVDRLFRITRQLQEEVPEMVIVGTGYSWLRQFCGHAAAANIRRGWATMVGLGREAIAYPEFARDLLSGKGMDPSKVCIACSRCAYLMQRGGPAGCVVRDKEIYAPIYRKMGRQSQG